MKPQTKQSDLYIVGATVVHRARNDQSVIVLSNCGMIMRHRLNPGVYNAAEAKVEGLIRRAAGFLLPDGRVLPPCSHCGSET